MPTANKQPLGPMINLNLGTPKIPASQQKLTVYELTPLGKTKVDDYEPTGARWEVMSELAVRGPSSIRELDENLKLGTAKIQNVLDKLTAEQMVHKKVGQGA